MMNFNRAGNSSLRLIIFASVAITFSLGFVNLPVLQSAQSLTNLAPNNNNQIEAAAGDTIQPADGAAKPLYTTYRTPIEPVWETLGQIDPEIALADLRRLTGEEPICTSDGCYTITNRETGTEGLKWAKAYVTETLIDLGYSVEVMDWSRSGYADQNIIARKPGVVYPAEEIYFIAHLDGYLLNNPAADDNASGVVSLLQLGRVLSTRSLNYTVVIFISTGEEHGCLGAHSFVDTYPERLGAIKYLVNVDMLSYDSNGDRKMELWNGDQPLDFVQLLSKIVNAYRVNLVPEIYPGCT